MSLMTLGSVFIKCVQKNVLKYWKSLYLFKRFKNNGANEILYRSLVSKFWKSQIHEII